MIEYLSQFKTAFFMLPKREEGAFFPQAGANWTDDGRKMKKSGKRVQKSVKEDDKQHYYSAKSRFKTSVASA